MPKRLRRETQLERTDITLPETPTAAIALIYRLAKKHNLDLSLLAEDIPDDDSEQVKLTFAEAAPLVGLEPSKVLEDIGTFELHHSRIPTGIFKSILESMDVIVTNYGYPSEHQTPTAVSKFFSWVYSHLFTLFGSVMKNDITTIEEERDGAQLYVRQFFKIINRTVVLVIETKLGPGDDAERLDAIAQIISEARDCSINNHSTYSIPIHCIFTDGSSFELYKYERQPNPSFLRGQFPDRTYSMQLPDPTPTEMKTYILQMRRICEVILDVMLRAYIVGLRAHPDIPADKLGSNPDVWNQVIRSAERALGSFRMGGVQHLAGQRESADASVNEGLLALKESTTEVPALCKHDAIPLVSAWNDEEVEKA